MPFFLLDTPGAVTRVERRPNCEGARLLDAGAGTGLLAHCLKERHRLRGTRIDPRGAWRVAHGAGHGGAPLAVAGLDRI